ncbi:S41 family peptidase [Deinococcus irradiatisoli]|uniref:S41 family peptidase n=1 Tax=Deinococcus irradiatisoli TaxID=2202254 RepID=UPI0011B1ED0C|nr:S41 family peptidase [Deinococcus irradiatisoli]
MNRAAPRLLLLSLSLLSACSTLPTPAPGASDDVPTVPRSTRPVSPDCAVRSLASQLSGDDLARLRFETFRPALHAQVYANTLAGLLLATRTDLNTQYYGFSSVDLQTLHETWEARFRAEFGDLKQPITAQADPLMDEYVAGVNDEHTYYLDPALLQAFEDQSNAVPTSGPRYGFRLAAVPGEDGAVLTDVSADSPAEEAGLQRGDTILSVNGAALNRGTDDDTAAAARYSAVLAAAATGQPVTLAIRRGETRLSVTVTPRPISSASLPSGHLDGATYVLRLPSFATEGTAQRVHQLVHAAQAAGAQRLVLDLRGNRGGLVSEATGVSAAFAPQAAGQTLEFLDAQDYSFFYQGGQVRASGVCFSGDRTLASIQNPALWRGPLEVLVNKDSASASEVVAQTLQQAGARALGEATVGVGNTATNILSLPGNRGLSVTVARSKALSGQYLSAKVAPTVMVSDDLKALAHGYDLPLEAALAAAP